VSGNPGGRPKTLPDLVEAARALTPRALAALEQALDDPDRAIPAAVALLDRAWGKPPIAVLAQMNNTVTVGGIDKPPNETLAQWVERRRRSLEALGGPQPPPPPVPDGYVLAPAPPNGGAAAPGEHTSERAAERPGASGSAGPSMSPERERWLQQERRRLGLDPTDVRPNQTLKR
jgi:hypothetical protein